MNIKPHKRFANVYLVDGRKLCTKNLAKGHSVYGEKIFKFKSDEYRVWDPTRSKISAAIYKKMNKFPIELGTKILYLGAASGTTISHLSDIVGKEGIIYGVEISERVFREIIPVAESRNNIMPILSNAKLPENYQWVEKVDIVFADVAVKDQSELFIRNCKLFLKDNGYAMIAIKARSIDVTASPRKVFDEQRQILEKYFKILDFVILDPYERDHCFFLLKKKN